MLGGERAPNFGVSRFQLDLSEVAFLCCYCYSCAMPDKALIQSVVAKLRLITSKSSFAKSLVDFYDTNGFLTPKQTLAGKKLVSRFNVNDHAYSWSILSDGLYIDSDEEESFVQVYKVFSINGKRSIRRRGLNSPSWATVVDNGFAHQRILKLLGDGDIRLLSFDEMIEIGRKTGLCCICGRSLDDAKSIEAGIGPVCAKKVMAGVVPDYKDEVE
jgi:hypothetical protein